MASGIRQFIFRASFLAAALLILAAGAGMPAFAQPAPGAKLHVVTTTAILADAVSEVGGEHVTAQALMGPGVDPHLYRQTSTDIAAATRADAVFWHGLHLEVQLQDFLTRLGKRKPVVALADTLPPGSLLASEDNSAVPDPHIWFDPRLWKQVVVSARDALIKLRPEAKADFTANADRYLAQIDAIAAYADKVLASVPARQRILVTAHDAFNYFGRAYGYEVRGIQGISTESEAGLRQIEEMVALLIERNIGAIFVETSVPERNVQALIEGAAAKGHQVTIGGALFSDAAGEAGTYEGTYIGMIDHNATVIARALGGEAPEKGFSDKLSGEPHP